MGEDPTHDLPDVRRETTGTKRRYVLDLPEGQAELEVSVTSPVMVIADHTLVPEGAEGRGVARHLLDALLADARTEGFRIFPLCPYVNAQRRKHPEWAALFSV